LLAFWSPLPVCCCFNEAHLETAFSVVITFGPTYFLSHNVMLCGTSKVAECAADILTFLDEQVHPQL
jgi:hypothetical protein